MFFRGREAGVPNSASFCSVLRRGRRWSDGGEREEVDVEERGAIVIILLAFTSLQLSPSCVVDREDVFWIESNKKSQKKTNLVGRAVVTNLPSQQQKTPTSNLCELSCFYQNDVKTENHFAKGRAKGLKYGLDTGLRTHWSIKEQQLSGINSN